ncbi:MAG: 4'-phosphopantetheinyl transferase superfamily protein [bacterium]
MRRRLVDMAGRERARVPDSAASGGLAPGAVVLWVCPTRHLGSDERERWYRCWLDDAERRRADGAGNAARRAEIIEGRALLRAALAAELGAAPNAWRFSTTPEGQPRVDPALAARSAGGVMLSLAHTRGLAVCALARGVAVGVDVERDDRRVEPTAIAGRFFSAHDARAVTSAPADARRAVFLERWMLREAYTKALGTPLLALDRQSVSFERAAGEARGAVRLTADSLLAAESWRFWMLEPTPEHRVAVAARRLTALAGARLAIRYWSGSGGG